mgnify:CR=1 FL=1
MKISANDYLLARACHQNGAFFKWLGDRETSLLRKQLTEIRIEMPVFITGLARAGTTLLLEILSRVDGVATHRYRDFPLVMAPYFWERFTSRYAVSQVSVERPHKDRIRITKESPEAFEEPIWQFFFPFVHDPKYLHKIGRETSAPEFERFFSDQLKKILLLRKGGRYLSKGNYNLTRIEYLSKVFPDARFVIPVRHPQTHVYSLMRQHKLFCEYSNKDKRVPDYLRAAGHYEFGPQRVPVSFSSVATQRILEAWQNAQEHIGYAIQWAQIYGYIAELRQQDKELSERIFLVRYEDMCANPKATLDKLLAFTGLPSGSSVLENLDKVSKSPHAMTDMPGAMRQEIWTETDQVAGLYGYRSVDKI